MPVPPHDAGRDGTHSLGELRALEEAGAIEIARPGTPEADPFDPAMADDVPAYNAKLLAHHGPDALTSNRQLRQAAVAAERDPDRVAAALTSYRERLGLEHIGLTVWLGVLSGTLAALALERRLDPSAAFFVDEVRRLAKSFGTNAGRVAEALR